MIERRQFLKMTGAGGALLGSGTLLSACSPGSDGPTDVAPVADDEPTAQGEAMSSAKSRYGVQLYTLRNELQVDVRQVLENLAEIGYREVELYGLGNNTSPDRPFFGLSAREFGAALENTGLSAPISHIDGDAENVPVLAEAMQEIGGEHLIVAMAPEFASFENGQFRFAGVTGRQQIDGIAERLTRQGDMARTSGIGFGYHNHQVEFESLGDETAFDYLFSQLDADLVKMELDLGWTMVAGMDPVALLNRYAGRVVSVHLKDHDPARDPGDAAIPVQAQIVEPGSGPTDFRAILAALDETGVDHRFVEIDLAPEPVASVTRGYRYLAGL